MAYDRYDTRHGPRDDHQRWFEDRHRGRRGERGFFERAADEIGSWFGGPDDDDHFRDEHYRPERGFRERGHGRGDDRERGGPERGYEQGQRGWRERGREWLSQARDDGREWFGGRDRGRNRDEEHGWFRTDSYRPDRDPYLNRPSRDQREGGYRPVTGDYGRSGGGRPETEWDRDDYRRTSFAGSSERSQHHDPHYQEWRERRMQELDRDYHDYHRERQSRFEDDFSNWRKQRQSKRQLLGEVREHMEVVGSDGEHVGTVDKVAGDRLILAKSDPASGGAHHSLNCTEVERIDDNRVLLSVSAEEARRRWRDEDRSRALFERPEQGEAGPRMLNRSFSGTYRD